MKNVSPRFLQENTTHTAGNSKLHIILIIIIFLLPLVHKNTWHLAFPLSVTLFLAFGQLFSTAQLIGFYQWLGFGILTGKTRSQV